MGQLRVCPSLTNFLMGPGLEVVVVGEGGGVLSSPEVICDNNSTECDIRHTRKRSVQGTGFRQRSWGKAGERRCRFLRSLDE